jgi:hypothetical protein
VCETCGGAKLFICGTFTLILLELTIKKAATAAGSRRGLFEFGAAKWNGDTTAVGADTSPAACNSGPAELFCIPCSCLCVSVAAFAFVFCDFYIWLLFFVTSMYGFSNGAANRTLRFSTSMIVTEDILIPNISDLYIQQYVSRDVSYLPMNRYRTTNIFMGTFCRVTYWRSRSRCCCCRNTCWRSDVLSVMAQTYPWCLYLFVAAVASLL